MSYPDDDSWWDYYSDQPYVLPGQSKPRLTGAGIVEAVKTLATLAGISPVLAWRYFRNPETPSVAPIKDFAGLSISPDIANLSAITEMVDELGVRQLLMRIPAWRAGHIDDYLEFAGRFPGQQFLVNILQNRESVLDPEGWQQNVATIISACQGFTQTFQIANATNRSKWGCHTMADYFALQNQVETLRNEFPEARILGSSVIDFEPLATLRPLVNYQPFHLDGAAALLYVNRRLSPYNRQFGIFDLEKKIRLIHAIVSLSNRSANKLWITETNWPLLGTRPWTPNSGSPRSTVDEPTQAEFLKQYYSIAYQTGLVEKVYWWQLINPGYGLVDSRGKSLRKMPSYYAFKKIIDGSFSLNH